MAMDQMGTVPANDPQYDAAFGAYTNATNDGERYNAARTLRDITRAQGDTEGEKIWQSIVDRGGKRHNR